MALAPHVADTSDHTATGREVMEVSTLSSSPVVLYSADKDVDFVKWDNTPNATTGYLKLFNDAAVVVTTDSPDFIFPMNPTSKNWIMFDTTLAEMFGTAVTVLATTTKASLTTQTAQSSTITVEVGTIDG